MFFLRTNAEISPNLNIFSTPFLPNRTLKFFGDEVTKDSLYVFNEDFAFAPAKGAGLLTDTNGGTDSINTSPCRGNVVVDLTPGDKGTSVVNGRPLRIKDGSVVENAFTGDGDDSLIGNSADNSLRAGRGDDTITGSPGSDSLDGGPGVDTVDYSKSSAGVSVDLAAGKCSGGLAEGDAVQHIEGAVGSDKDDTLQGDSGPNVLSGNGGDDTLEGRGGDDVLNGGAGSDVLKGGDGDDVLSPGFGKDETVDGGAGVDVLVLLGHSTDYKITFGSSSTVLEATGNKITAAGIEFVQFADKKIALLAKTNRAPIPPQAGIKFDTDEGSKLVIKVADIIKQIKDPEQDKLEVAYLRKAANGAAALAGQELRFVPTRARHERL